MMWYYGWGGMPFLGMAFMLLFWLALALLAVWAVRAFSAAGMRRPPDPALERLRQRFAAGEISQVEYEQALRAIGGPTPASR